MESTSKPSKSEFSSSKHGFDEEMQLGKKGPKNSDGRSGFDKRSKVGGGRHRNENQNDSGKSKSDKSGNGRKSEESVVGASFFDLGNNGDGESNEKGPRSIRKSIERSKYLLSLASTDGDSDKRGNDITSTENTSSDSSPTETSVDRDGNGDDYYSFLDYVARLEKKLGIHDDENINHTESKVSHSSGSRISGVIDEVLKLEKELGIGAGSKSIDNAPNPNPENVAAENFADNEGVSNAEDVSTAKQNSLRDSLIVKSILDGRDGSMNTVITLLDEVQLLRERVKDVEKVQEEELMSENFDEEAHWPEDCYSFIAINGPRKGEWPRKKIISFSFGMMVHLFQMLLLVLLLLGGINVRLGTVEESENPWSERERAPFASFIPPNAKQIVRISQMVALLVYAIFPCASQQDVAKAIQLYPTARNRDDISVFYERFSCILRGLQGCCAAITVWVLVVTSKTVVDIVLNFTAVAFVSSLDDDAFSLAKGGVFGIALQEETARIAKTKLPESVYEKSKNVWYWYWRLMVGTAAVLCGTQIFVISAQTSSEKWLTRQFRVEFEATEFRKYSGCYVIDDDSKRFQRYTYHSVREDRNSSIGYCLDEREWILYNARSQYDDSDVVTACNARDKGSLRLRSTNTDSFDISASFEYRWLSSSGTPIDMFFFEGEDDDELYCNHTLGDGICDEVFNNDGYKYDLGDCCPCSCNGIDCGRGALTNVFGSNLTGDGFPSCKNSDHDLVPLTIQLNGLTSNREFVDTSNWLFFLQNATQWKNVPPVPTFLSLECNDHSVLTVYVTGEMLHGSETVMVEDGSECTMVVKNTTGFIDPSKTWVSQYEDVDGSDILTTAAFWYVDYSIFHEVTISNQTEKIEILSQRSDQQGEVSFKVFGRCILEQLKNHSNITTIYKPKSGSSEEAIGWLANDDSKISRCGEDHLFDRYALVSIIFGMTDEKSSFVNRNDHCTWPYITCNGEGRVNVISVPQVGFKGELPTSIGLLKELERLELRYNEITSIPTEITSLDRLVHLELGTNNLTSLPTDIGVLTGLDTLELSRNELTSIPTEIGLMTGLRVLAIDNSTLTHFPTEIGLLENLVFLCIGANNASIPREIFEMSSLEAIELYDMGMTSIPSEIGLMTNLEWLRVWGNPITSFPTEIGLLTNLWHIALEYEKQLTFPEEMNLLTNLRDVIVTPPEDDGSIFFLDFKGGNYSFCEAIEEQFKLPCLSNSSDS